MCDRLLTDQHNRAARGEPHYWPKGHPAGARGQRGHRAPRANVEQFDRRLLGGGVYILL